MSAERIAALETRLASLEEQLATEVRTRRVVVVDETGYERVVLTTLLDAGAVEVFGKPRDRKDPMSVALIASEESVETCAGLYVSGVGDTLATVEVMDYGDEGVAGQLEVADRDPDEPDRRVSTEVMPHGMFDANIRCGGRCSRPHPIGSPCRIGAQRRSDKMA